MTKDRFSHKIDDLGRLLMPNELRNELGWETGDTLSLCRLKDTVVVSLEKKKGLGQDCSGKAFSTTDYRN